MSLIKTKFTYWQESERSEKMRKLFDSGLLADCKFVVGPEDATAETINGHKIMFAMESPVLERMLTGDFFEAENEIRIQDVDPHDFKNFCYMIYNNNSANLEKFTLEEIIELYRISDKYLAQSICETCISFLKGTVNGLFLDRLIIIFEFATGLEDKSLQTIVEKEISTNNAPESLMIDKLNELSSKVFYDYVLFVSKLPTPPRPIIIFTAIDLYFKRNHLMKKEVLNAITETIPEKKIKENMIDKTDQDQAVTETVATDVKEIKAIMENTENVKDLECKEINNIHSFKKMLFELVKFSDMTTLQFIKGPGKSDLLDLQQKFETLSFICTTKDRFKVYTEYNTD